MNADEEEPSEEPSAGAGRFERNAQGLLFAAIVVAALALFVDWSNVWAALRPLLDFLLE